MSLFFIFVKLGLFMIIKLCFSLIFAGDPQEECVRCGSVYLASSIELKQGFCETCLKNTEGTEDQEVDVGDEVLPIHHHKKFNEKLTHKSTGEMTTESSTEDDNSNSSSARFLLPQHLIVN